MRVVTSKLAVAALVISVPVGAWWLVGPLDKTVRDLPLGVDPNYDFIFRPPALDATVERSVGVISLLVVLAALAVVIHARRRGSLDPRWTPVTIWTVISGVAIGGAARVVTAGSSGANIGGALLLMVLPPVLLAGWVIAAVLFARAGSHRTTSQAAQV